MAGALALSAAAAAAPLLDGLTYEYAVVVALGALAAGVLRGSRDAKALATPYALRFKLLRTTPAERCEPLLRASGTALCAAVVAAALLPAWRGARAGCAWERGVPVYLLVALPAPLLGLALGAVARACAPASRRRRLALVAAFVLAAAALTAWEVLAGPRAVFHSLLLGVVSSTAYLGFDETVRIAPADVMHRAAALVVAAGLLAAALARAAAAGRPAPGHDGARVRLLLDVERRGAVRRGLVALGLLVGMAAVGAPCGFGSGRDALERRLAGRFETAHLVLRFRPRSRAESLAPRLGADAEWAWLRMSRLLGLDPAAGAGAAAGARKPSVWIYEDDREQIELTGTAGFLFAKPWRGEVHTRLDETGDLVQLPHELVHVLAAGFGLPVVRVSARYGLIEGLAEGVAGGYAEADFPHEPAAAALRAGMLPPAGAVIDSAGFAALDARVSYVAAASFCGWLLAEHGPARLRDAYAWGDLERAYGQSLAALDDGWRGYLARVPVDRRALEVWSRAFDRETTPPFFRRACARLGLRAAADAVPACARPWECAPSGPALEEALAGLDRDAALGPLLARDLALARLGEALARAGRLEEAAAACGRRVDLGVAPRLLRGVLAAAAADPDRVPATLVAAGALEATSPLVARDVADDAAVAGEASPARRVLAVAVLLASDPAPRAAVARIARLGGCDPALAPLEARLLVRGAALARRAGDRDAAITLARAALALDGALAAERFAAAEEIARSSPGGSEGVNAFQ